MRALSSACSCLDGIECGACRKLRAPRRRRAEPTLTKAQERFLLAIRASADGVHTSPFSYGRASVSRLAAWHRTATSLKRRGLVTVETNGSMFFAREAK